MSSKAIGLLLLAGLVLGGCKHDVEKVAISAAGQSLTVEVARSEAQRERGLMERTNLGSRDGMIFVFDREDHLTFWMKDTPAALSIAFLSTDGKVLEIRDMEPFSEKIIRSRLAARYALEMKKGAFADLGIGEGERFTFPDRFP